MFVLCLKFVPSALFFFFLYHLQLYLVQGTEIFMFYTGGLVSAVRAIIRVSSYGSTPSAEELANDPKCSICYETMQDPIKVVFSIYRLSWTDNRCWSCNYILANLCFFQLKCTHMFCEICVETWLDQQQTCPMCRAKVDGDDKSWRNGATSKMIRLYWHYSQRITNYLHLTILALVWKLDIVTAPSYVRRYCFLEQLSRFLGLVLPSSTPSGTRIVLLRFVRVCNFIRTNKQYELLARLLILFFPSFFFFGYNSV